MKIVTTLVVAASLFFATMVNANCVCRCVNGNMEALCSSSIDMRPICSPTICPIVPPSVTPIQTPTVPPVGTSSCAPEQVYDSNTGGYKWATICR